MVLRPIARVVAVALLAACGPVSGPSELPRPEPARRPAVEPDRPPTAAPSPATANPPAELPPPPTPAPASAEAPFELAWSRAGVRWTKSVVLTPWGDLVSFGARKLRLLAGDNGDVLTEKGICYTFAGAFGFVDAHTGVLVCEDGIKLFDFPGLSFRGVRSLPGKARTASFGRKLVAVGFAEGPVRIYETTNWTQTAFFGLGERASALALSPDEGTLAVGLRDGRLVLCEISSQTQRSLRPRPAQPVDALAFSPEGERLFSAAGTAGAVWQVSDGARLREIAAPAEVSAASWTSAAEIATTGPGGLILLSADADGHRSLGGPPAGTARPASGLSLAAERRVLCTSATDGLIRCFSRGPLASSGSERAAGSDRATASAVAAGRLVGHTGRRLTMRAHARGALPAAGRRATLRRHVLLTRGELRSSEWPAIAEVQVDEVRHDVLHLTIVADHSASALPEGETEPFAYDAAVRLIWTDP